MQPIGWILFFVSNIVVIGLVVFCFYRVFSLPKEHMSAPLDIDTHDLEEMQEENGDNGDISMPDGTS